MNGSVQIGPGLSKLWDDFKGAVGQAVTSLPSIPAGKDLVTIETSGNLLTGEGVVVEATPELQAIVGSIVAKLNAFAAQK